MKVLRVLRRKKIKLSFILLFLLVFIVNTYAWMRTDREGEVGKMVLNVNDWSVAFIVDDEEILTEEYIFEVEEFYPGIEPIEKKIDVYNIGEANSYLKYEITEIYLYGEQILNTEVDTDVFMPETLSEEITDANGRKTANLFGNEDATIFEEDNTNYSFSLKYPTPFTISYTYDRTHISGKEFQETATSWMSINLAWYNDEANNEEDTRLGNMVYNFENLKDAEGNLINEDMPALRIVAKVTATRDLES